MNKGKNKTSLDNDSVLEEHGMSSAIFNTKHCNYAHSNSLYSNGGAILS